MALANDTQRLHAGTKIDKGPRPQVLALAVIFQWSAIGEVIASGFMQALTAADVFRGFATRGITGGAANGDERIELYHAGRVQLSVAAAVITDIGAAVYATDDDTFVLTEAGNPFIGRIVEFISAGLVWVQFDAGRGSLAGAAELTDNSGGAADDTIAAITNANNVGSADVVPTQNAIADLAAKVNFLLRQLQ